MRRTRIEITCADRQHLTAGISEPRSRGREPNGVRGSFVSPAIAAACRRTPVPAATGVRGHSNPAVQSAAHHLGGDRTTHAYRHGRHCPRPRRRVRRGVLRQRLVAVRGRLGRRERSRIRTPPLRPRLRRRRPSAARRTPSPRRPPAPSRSARTTPPIRRISSRPTRRPIRGSSVTRRTTSASRASSAGTSPATSAMSAIPSPGCRCRSTTRSSRVPRTSTST